MSPAGPQRLAAAHVGAANVAGAAGLSENRTRMDDVVRTPEGDLARRARLGDRAAFDALYRRYARGVHAVLAARVRADEADDLVQDVFVRAWHARGDLREPDRVGAWLCAIARREAHATRRARQPEMLLPDDLPARASDDGETRDEAERVLTELRALPESYRETLSLRLLGECSGAEIARLTGMTHGSVRVNLHKGMELLRERLSRGVVR
jgi:RNA polymerase sigma-70 factor (ECF subfamily)